MKNLIEFGKRVREKRIELNMTQEELATKSGYTSRSSINKIELGLVDLPQSKIIALADALMTTPTYLMKISGEVESSDFPILRPIRLKKFRMLGEIACGEPIFANEDHETYIDASADIKADFCLTAKGDSMTGARIFDGDVVDNVVPSVVIKLQFKFPDDTDTILLSNEQVGTVIVLPLFKLI